MKKISLFLIQALIALSLALAVGCSKNDPSVDPEKPPVTDPNAPISDPSGTVTANISETTSINIQDVGFITWIGPDNFNLFCAGGYSSVSICDLGAMKGLGNITNFPQTGYTAPQSSNTTVACQAGHGYVIKFEGSIAVPQYVSLYVMEPIVDTGGGIMGEKVKYQYTVEAPALTVSKDSLSFSGAQGTQTVTVTTNAADWTYSCNAAWLTFVKNANTLSVTAAKTIFARSGVISIQGNSIQKNIKVTQAMMTTTSAPYAIGDGYNENGVMGVVYKISSGGTHGMIVSITETTCAWSTEYVTTGCTDPSNGMNNMNIIKGISGWDSKYPAFKWCNDFNTGSVTGWYLPAQSELNDLYMNYNTLNTTTFAYGGVPISSDYYWSSSGKHYQ